MHTFLIVLHVMVCFVLILVVLLQRGKGSDMGAALGGGGSNTVFGSRGAGNFLTKLTTGSAIGFMLTSLSLSYLSQDAKVLDFDEAVLEEPAPADAPSAEALEEVDVDPGATPGAAAGGTGDSGASADELIEIEVDEGGGAPPSE